MKTFDELKKESIAIIEEEEVLAKKEKEEAVLAEKRLYTQIEEKLEEAIISGLAKKQESIVIKGLYPSHIVENILKQQKYSFINIHKDYYICLEDKDMSEYKESIKNKYLENSNKLKSNFITDMVNFSGILITLSIVLALIYFIQNTNNNSYLHYYYITDILPSSIVSSFPTFLYCIEGLFFVLWAIVLFCIVIRYYDWKLSDSEYVKEMEESWATVTCWDKNKGDIKL